MKSVIKKLLESVMKQKTYFDGVLIPAKHLRLCGDAFKDDKYFFNLMLSEFDYVLDKFDYEVETHGQSALYLSHK